MRCWAKRSQLKVFSAFSGSGAHGDCADSYQNHGWHPLCVARRAGPGPETRPCGLGTGGAANKPVRRTRAWGGVHRAGGGEHRPTQRVGPRLPGTTNGPVGITRFPQRRQVAGWPRGAHSAGACRQSGYGRAPHGALKSVLQMCSTHHPRAGSEISVKKISNQHPVSVGCYEKSKPVASQAATGFSVRLPRAGGRPPRTVPTQGGFSGPACHGTFFAVDGPCGRARRAPPD